MHYADKKTVILLPIIYVLLRRVVLNIV